MVNDRDLELMHESVGNDSNRLTIGSGSESDLEDEGDSARNNTSELAAGQFDASGYLLFCLCMGKAYTYG